MPTIWAAESQNNEIGLPLTVCRLEPETEILVTEMGMRGLGQIAELCAIARPDVVVVSSIGPEHLELVGTVERVAEANAEAIVALPPGGIAVVPADAPELEPHLDRTDIEIRRFDRAAIRGEGHEWTFPLPGGEITLTLPFTARHMAENTLAALTAYEALGLPLEQAQEGANAITLSRWRGEETPLARRRHRRQRRLQRQPDVDAGRARRPRRARGRPASRRDPGRDGRARGRGARATTRRSAPCSTSSGSSSSSRSARAPVRISAATPTPTRRWIPDAAAFDDVASLLQPGDAILVKASRAVGLEGIPASIEKRARAWSES